MITLSAIPSYVEIAAADLAVDQPVKSSVVTQLAHNAKFAMVRREVFQCTGVHGDQIAAPVSPIDGYQYSYAEVTFFWTRSASCNPTTMTRTGSGCVLDWTDAVDANGNVTMVTDYYIDGGAETATHDGELNVMLLCQRYAGLKFSAIPVWADVEDADLAGGEALLASNLAQMAQNAQYACVRKEFFVQKLYNGQSVAPCVSPVDGYTYQTEYANALQPPAAPTLSSVASGALAANSYNVQLTYVNQVGETTPSPSAQINVAANSVPHVASPAASGNAIGYNVYAGNGPAAPVLSQVAGGSQPARTVYIVITYTGPNGETSACAEVSLAVAAGNVPVVTSPAAAGTATGYNVYASLISGQEQLQNAAPIALGTNWTGATGGLGTGAASAPDGPTLQNTTPIAIGTDWQMDLGGLKKGELPPLANSTAMSEMQFVPSMISSLNSSGQRGGSGCVKQFGCCVGGMPNVTTPTTPGAVSSYVQYQVNGGVYTPTNDGTILVLIVCTRERGNPPIPPAIRIQPPPPANTQFGIYATPQGATVDGYPIKGVGDAQTLDINSETKNNLLYGRSSSAVQAGLTQSGNFTSGRLLGGDDGLDVFGGGGLLGFGRSPITYLLEAAGWVGAVGHGPQLVSDDTSSGGTYVGWQSSDGGILESITGTGRRRVNSVGFGFDRTPATYELEAAGCVQAVYTSAAFGADDTSSGGALSWYASQDGYARQSLNGAWLTALSSSGHLGIDMTPVRELDVAGILRSAASGDAECEVYDTASGGGAFDYYTSGGVLIDYDNARQVARTTLTGAGLLGIGRSPTSYLLEAAGWVGAVGNGPQLVSDDTSSGGTYVGWQSSDGGILESITGTGRRRVNSVGFGFDRTPATYELEAAGCVQAVYTSAAFGADDTSSGGTLSWYASQDGYARQSLNGAWLTALSSSGLLGVGGVPMHTLDVFGDHNVSGIYRVLGSQINLDHILDSAERFAAGEAGADVTSDHCYLLATQDTSGTAAQIPTSWTVIGGLSITFTLKFTSLVQVQYLAAVNGYSSSGGGTVYTLAVFNGGAEIANTQGGGVSDGNNTFSGAGYTGPLSPGTYTFSVEAQAGATPNNGYQGKGALTIAVFPG